MKYKYDYMSEYIPSWDKTVIHIIIYDNDGNKLEHTDTHGGKLTDSQVAAYFEDIYYNCLEVNGWYER